MNPAVLRRKNKTSLKYMSARGYQLGVSSCEQVTFTNALSAVENMKR